MLVDWRGFIEHVIGDSYIQSILQTRPHKSTMAQAKSLQEPFEMQLYHHTFLVLEECMQTKLVSTVRIYKYWYAIRIWV